MADLIPDAVKEVALEAYKDVAQPTTSVIGKTLGRCVRLALAPINGVAWVGEFGAQKIEDAVKAKLEKKGISKEQIVIPDPLVAGQIYEAYKFAEHTDLKNLFIELLASSMNKDTAQKAHPSFVQILRSMTPDEARILAYLSLNEAQPDVDIHSNNEDGSYEILYRHLSYLGKNAQCGFSELVPSYVDNLIRLGLIYRPAGSLASESDKKLYDDLEKDITVTKIKAILLENGKNGEMTFKRSALVLNDFGNQFCEACGIGNDTSTFIKQVSS